MDLSSLILSNNKRLSALQGYINSRDDLVIVNSESDLPDPVTGTITLEDNTAYYFTDIVISTASLVLGANTPLVGLHGGKSGFIHTGGATAIQSTGNPIFMRDLSINAPGGTMFDLDGVDATTEFLVESCAFSDFANLGNIASLGTIANFRVPSFKGCNFENFNAGITFTGSPDKVHITGSPLRGVTAADVTLVTFDADFSGDIIDINGNYVKGLQSDTEIIRVDPGAVIHDILQYTGNTHDDSVNIDNILVGAASKDSVGYLISNSYPLANSVAVGSFTLDTDTETVINTTATNKTDDAAFEVVEGNTTPSLEVRYTHDNLNNTMTYLGKKEVFVELTATLTLGTGNDDLLAVAWFKNGVMIPGSSVRVRMSGTAGGIDTSVAISGVCPSCNTGDVYDVRIANLTSTTNVNVAEISATLSATG